MDYQIEVFGVEIFHKADEEGRGPTLRVYLADRTIAEKIARGRGFWGEDATITSLMAKRLDDTHVEVPSAFGGLSTVTLYADLAAADTYVERELPYLVDPNLRNEDREKQRAEERDRRYAASGSEGCLSPILLLVAFIGIACYGLIWLN